MADRVIAGSDVFLYVGTTLVGCVTSATLNVSREMLDAACKSSGAWTEQAPGRKSWSIDADGVYKIYDSTTAAANYDAIEFWNNLDNGTALTVKFGTSQTGDIQFTGTAFVTDWSLEGGDDNATYSLSLTGSGPLTTAVVAA